ncbi:hypothetical protein F4802DRAFT_595719 [Xylaria palmicola]|nr:hypothetical protein F4802DRAFT_595719 [Xylaria palmicola]
MEDSGQPTNSAIRAGYKVRAIVGTLEGLLEIEVALFRFSCHFVEIVIIGNLAERGLIDMALLDAEYVIHTMPLTLLDLPSAYTNSNNASITLNLLHRAQRTGTIRRIVFTSTVVQYLSAETLDDSGPSDQNLSNKGQGLKANNQLEPDNQNSGPQSSGCQHHDAQHSGNSDDSKSLADAITNTPLKQFAPMHSGFRENFGFDYVYLLCCNVFGPDPMSKTTHDFGTGSNAVLLSHIFGTGGDKLFTKSAHIDDVAKCHVRALEEAVLPGEYQVPGQTFEWSDAHRFVKKYHPEYAGPVFGIVDSSEDAVPLGEESTASVARGEWKSFEAQVKDTVDCYLDMICGRRYERRMTEYASRSFH